MDNEKNTSLNQEPDTSAAENNKEVKDKNKKKSGMGKHIPFYIIEVLLLMVSVFALYVVSNATRMEKIVLDTEKILVNEGILQGGDETEPEAEAAEEETPKPTATPLKPAEATEDVAYQMSREEKDKLSNELKEKYGDTFNLAFFGVDSREGELGAQTRSDSMIICSVNMDTHEVKLISIFRDTYLNLGNGKYNKCNAAYANGGPEQALSMINMNTDLYLTEYVTVGFVGLVKAIDALGGVPIDVTEEEIFHLNNYQITMADELGMDYTPVVYPGMQMLNGLQATAYCRIRYTAGYDFKRAERQRTVITAMLERAGKVSLPQLTQAITSILPNVQTSLDLSELIQMASLASDYEVTVSDGFPFEGMRNGGNIGTKGSCVIPADLTRNVKKLHEVLFDEENYSPSNAVRSYSQQIIEDTQDYLLY